MAYLNPFCSLASIFRKPLPPGFADCSQTSRITFASATLSITSISYHLLMR